MKLYLAGPLFTAAERNFNTELAIELRRLGYVVYVPQDNEPREKNALSIFLADKDGIDKCDVVVACMDGPDPDSGTCWECGYAYGKKPIVVFRTDFRAADDAHLAPFNLMLVASASSLVMASFCTVPQLSERLHHALRQFNV